MALLEGVDPTMAKHLSIRFAWHDDKWDGGVCQDPERNIYCTGNYSLLSPRIQRRIKLDVERRCKNQGLSKVLAEHGYLPPCYWCINALGNKEYEIEEIHPFADSRRKNSRDFQEVPPIKYNLDKFSAFSWNFKIGYDTESPIDRYVHWQELQERTDDYLSKIEKGKSIAFFYANFSNPLTADSYKYLLLGAGLVKKTDKPKDYKVPQELLDRVRSQPTMRNMPTLAWQFQLIFEPDSVFVLPYHEYLNVIAKEVEDDVIVEHWRKLDDVTVAIKDTTIIPKDTSPRDNFDPVTVPKGFVFVMGDNRDYSLDSRFYGFIDIGQIKGKALYVYWAKDRKRIGFEFE